MQVNFHEPQQRPRNEPIPFPEVIQELDLVVTAEQERVVEMVEDTLNTLCAFLSFGTRRPVEWTVGRLTEAEAEEGHEPRSFLPVTSFGYSRPPLGFRTKNLNELLEGIRGHSSKQGRKLIRALRWLHRSRTTADYVEKYSFLAMSYSSLTSLLPTPPSHAESTSQDRARGWARRVYEVLSGYRHRESSKAPGESAVLRHFATEVVGVPSGKWRKTWKLRHKLFHGALLESRESDERLSAAIPVVRRVVIEALRDLLDLPEGIPADDPLDEIGIVSLPVEFRPDEEFDDDI